jgi:hypothetical protein
MMSSRRDTSGVLRLGFPRERPQSAGGKPLPEAFHVYILANQRNGTLYNPAWRDLFADME